MPASNYALRLPASLKREVQRVARDDGSTLNQFIVSAVAEKLAALSTADFFEGRTRRADTVVALDILNREGGAPPRADDGLP